MDACKLTEVSMNCPGPEMTTTINSSLPLAATSGLNVTTRKPPKQTSKMATMSEYARPSGMEGGSLLLIDSILSKAEESEVSKMLEMEGEVMDDLYPVTSTQMVTCGNRWSKRSPLMSPIMSKDYQNPSCSDMHNASWLSLSNRFGALNDEEELQNRRNTGVGKVENLTHEGNEREKDVQGVDLDTAGRALHDGSLGTAGASALRDLVSGLEDGGTVGRVTDENGQDRALHNDGSYGEDVGVKDVGEEDEGADEEDTDSAPGEGDDSETAEISKEELKKVSRRLESVDRVLSLLGSKSDILVETVEGLKDSLEFSQKEVDTLKDENYKLKQKIADLEIEGSRTNYQLKKMDEKIDRVDTLCKKKNLIFEGIPELHDGKEDVEKTVWNLFDQLEINTGINFDACYRQGNYNKNRDRPIVITFQKQADRDLVYSSRMNLRRTQNYKHVWVNEDLGQASRKMRNIIRLIAKQAHADGVDCRTGKYDIRINKQKYESHNLDELPPQLLPSSVKQVQIDANTVAYQSEFAPFSNLYQVGVTMGKYKFTCLEQAFQFVKAKTLNKNLAATRIYLSREPMDTKRIGDELGTSDEWELKKFDVMYECLKLKFEQNEGLKAMLLATGNCQLVEATPNRLWGCGATLSSNHLRRHEWLLENRQGKILMTVREELQRAERERNQQQ